MWPGWHWRLETLSWTCQLSFCLIRRAGEFYQELSQHKCHGNIPLQLWPLLCLLLTPGMINCTLASVQHTQPHCRMFCPGIWAAKRSGAVRTWHTSQQQEKLGFLWEEARVCRAGAKWWWSLISPNELSWNSRPLYLPFEPIFVLISRPNIKGSHLIVSAWQLRAENARQRPGHVTPLLLVAWCSAVSLL